MTDEQKIIQWLRDYRHIPLRIEHLKDAKTVLEEMKYGSISVPSSNPEIAPIKDDPYSDPTYQAVLKLCKKYDNDIAELITEMDDKRLIRSNVDKIMEWLFENDDHAKKVNYELIRLRYFEGLSISRISKLFLKNGQGRYKDSSLFRMHNRIISDIYKYWNLRESKTEISEAGDKHENMPFLKG